MNGTTPREEHPRPPLGTLVVAAAPCLASLILLPGPLPESPVLLSDLLQRVILFLTFCLVWNTMRDRAFALYLYKQDDAAPTGTIFRHLGIFLLFCVLLVTMEIIRRHIDRPTYLVMMALLPLSALVQSLRHRGRPDAAFGVNALTQVGWATISFVVFQGLWDWRAVIFSVGFATPAAAVMDLARRTRLTVPAVRRAMAAVLIAGPGLIGILPMLGQLPRIYLLTYLTLPIFARVAEKVQKGAETPGHSTAQRALRSFLALIVLLVMFRFLQTVR